MTKQETKIKVVYFVGEMAKGGSERQLYLLIKHMNESIIEPYILVFNHSPNCVYTEELLKLGFRIEEIPSHIKGILPRVRYLYSKVNEFKPHIIHSWTVHDNPYATLVGLLARVPVKLGSMRDSLKNKNFVALPKVIQLLTLWSVPLLFVNSRSILKELELNKYPSKRIRLLDNCVEIVSPCDKARLENCLPLTDQKAPRVVGTVANIRRKKNIHIFIEGMSLVINNHPDVYGLIIGQPVDDEKEYYLDLQNQISSLGLENKVILFGFYNDVPALMHHLSIFCLLSSYEGMPNAVMEAMAAACPVVATKVGGIPDLITNGINGILVNPGDVYDFASALQNLLAHPNFAKKLGESGREKVSSEYSCQVICNRLVDIYIDILH